MLDGKEPSDPRFPGVEMNSWSTLSLTGGNTGGNSVATMRSQLILPNDFQKKVSKLLTPGTILVATSERSNASTRSGTGFDIIGTDKKQ